MSTIPDKGPDHRPPTRAFGSQSFIQNYPAHTKRVLKTTCSRKPSALGLTRGTFDINDRVEPSFSNAVIQELGLQTYWAPRDEMGQLKL